MTKNQVEYWKVQEQVRANRAQEEENHRANVAREQQAANELGYKDIQYRTTQAEAERANKAKEAETQRHNVATETEATRSNLEKEKQNRLELGFKRQQHYDNTVFKGIETSLSAAKLAGSLVDMNFKNTN